MMRRSKVLLLLILALAAFLRLYRLNSLMRFIGDQGWFYLSARDMLLTGKIPLVGITASHSWLHQGPLWTYVLALFLKIGNFNPLLPGYMTAAIDVLTVGVIYFVGNLLFSENVGLLASFIYAFSPLVVTQARMPYHTSLIPFAVLIFLYSLVSWVRGKRWGFIVSIFLLAILYNFELATVVLVIVFLLIAGYGFYTKEAWFLKIVNKRYLVVAGVLLLIPLLPVIIYDTSHGYPQTLRFGAWLVYAAFRPLLALFIPVALVSYNHQFLPVTLSFIQKLFFPPSALIALFVLLGGISLVCFKKGGDRDSAFIVTLLVFFITAVSYLAMGTPSEAYLPMIVPESTILISLGIFFVKGKIRGLLIILVFFICIIDVYVLIAKNYFMGRYGFQDRLDAAKTIVREAENRPYSLIGQGPGSKFESFTMNYTYLTWWLGHAPAKVKAPLRFVINETPGGIIIEKNSKN